MKKLLVLTFLIALTASPASAMGEAATFTTGNDWIEKMTPIEKFMSVALPMAMLQQHGVPVRLTPEQYIPVIDRVMLGNPDLGGEDVANIFASTVYSLEPYTRPALDSLEQQFLRGEYRPIDSASLSLFPTVE